MKIVLIVPDGVAVRNYLYSNFVEELAKKGFEIYVFHQIPNAAINEIQAVTQSIKEFHFIPYFTEPAFARIIREATVYARIQINKKLLKNKTIQLFWNENKKGFKRKILNLISKTLGFIFSKSYNLLRFFEKFYDKMFLKTEFTAHLEKELKKIQPDLILNLHQRSLVCLPVINYANKNNIKTATVIFSWDNVPKARLISRYETYFVWSQLMKNDLKLLYPEINENQIKIVGTPQFEFYLDKKNHQTKEELFNKYGLEVSKKTICFSSNDTSSPYDAVYFNDICEAISEIEIDKRPQIIFRINPFDKSGRFENVLEKYKSIIKVIQPDWRTESSDEKSFINIFPSFNDVTILVNTVLHSDLVVNLGSTMAHDFAVLDKPCLYLNYNPKENVTLKVEDVYQFQHFKSMENLDAVGWINNKLEIKKVILNALEFPNEVAKDRKKWMEIIVKHPLDENSKCLANEIERICTFVS